MKVYFNFPGGPCETEIDTNRKIGQGATANIYRVGFGGQSWAAKIYNNDRGQNSKKVTAMLENVPGNTRVQIDGRYYPQFAWPVAQLNDQNGKQVGYLMPLVDVDESYTLDHYYDQGLFKKLNQPEEAALSYKLEIAQNLSSIVAELHKHQHYFIDFKPQNIRVFRRTHVVTLLDCDGFSIFGNDRRYPAELLSTDYISPEAQRRNKSPSELAEPQDRYALAVILFQLLNRGTHPFQGIVTAPNVFVNTNDEKAAAGLYPHGLTLDSRIKPRPQSIHHLWLDDTRLLFDKAFTTGSPSARPSARKWASHFESILKNKEIVRCEQFPNSFEHIRFKGKDCPECYIRKIPIYKSKSVRRNQTKLSPSPNVKNKSTSYNTGWAAGAVFFIIFLIVINSGDKSKNNQVNNTALITNQAPSDTSSNQPQTSLISFDTLTNRDYVYKGNLKDGKPDGEGTITFYDGHKYIGKWEGGQRNGHGTYTWPEGQKYVGNFKDGKQNGHGTYTWPDGQKYVGNYKDDMKNGNGTYTWPEGHKYVGNFKDDKQNGHGTYTWPNGDKYVGNFKNDMQNGHGTKTDNFGNVIHSGQWINDKPVETQTIIQQFNTEKQY